MRSKAVGLARWLKEWLKGLNWGLVALIVAAAYILAERAVHTAGRIAFFSTHFQGVAIDGAFQVFDPLRRLAAGQVPGVDFQFFHGLGTLLVHYPLFALFGKNLAASELARETMAPLLLVVSAAVLLYVATRRVAVALVGTALVWLLFPVFIILALPAGSLLGVRSTTPLLVGAAIMVLHRQPPGRRRVVAKAAVLGLLALSFVMSVEHGLAAIAAYVVMEGVLAAGAWKARLVRLAREMAILGVVVLAAFGLISGGHLFEPLLYALRDVPGDQFWYFGAPPNAALLSAAGIFTNGPLMACWVVGIGAVTVLLRWRTPAELVPQKRGFLFLLAYGLVTTLAMFGIQSEAYLQPFARIVVLGAVCWAYLLWQRWPRRPSAHTTAMGVAVGLLAVNFVTPMPPEINRMPHITRSLPTASGMKLSPAWADYVEVLRDTVPKGAALWSTYSSIAEAEFDTFSPAGYDYIIHALGPQRRDEYVERFVATKPAFVNTVRRAYTAYEEWLEMSHWQWYEWLLLNYHYRTSTSFTHIWERNNDGWKNPKDLGWMDEVKSPKDNVRLAKLPEDLPDGSIVTVQVDYRAINRLGWVPLFGKMDRYFVAGYDSAHGMPVSLPPDEHTWEFPVITQAGRVPRLYFYTGEPVPGARLDVTAVRYRVLPVSETTRRVMLDARKDPSFVPLKLNGFVED
jgi:hypothetical protein